jgi:hypothetical protein
MWRTIALTLGAFLVALLGAWAAMFASGWRLYRDDRAAAQPAARSSAAAERWAPPLGPNENPASRLKRLAHNVASSLAATNLPNPSQVLAEAKDLASKGHYEEALQRHIWYHNHALQYDPGQFGVRISFALSDWMELGRKYPKAKEALKEISGHDNREFAEGSGDFALFQEVAAINGYLQLEDDTIALFKRILKQDIALANRCYLVAEDLLVKKGEYDLCASLIPDSGSRFNSIREDWERASRRSYPLPQMQASLHRVTDENFVRQTRNLIEILVATGRKTEAEQIRNQALGVLDDPRLGSAVVDAEKKLAK